MTQKYRHYVEPKKNLIRKRRAYLRSMSRYGKPSNPPRYFFCTSAQSDRTHKKRSLYLLRRPRVRIHCRAWSRAPINEEGARGARRFCGTSTVLYAVAAAFFPPFRLLAAGLLFDDHRQCSWNIGLHFRSSARMMEKKWFRLEKPYELFKQQIPGGSFKKV